MSAQKSPEKRYINDLRRFAFGQEQLVDKWIAGECVKIRFTTNVSSDVYYEGDATITSVELNSSGAEEAASFSLTLENAGAITKGTVA